jgi:hypothetical protein
VPKLSSEFLNNIPNFSLSGDLGGSVCGTVDRENEMGWQQVTSKGVVDVSLIENGLRVVASDIGVSVIYDNNGKLSDFKMEVLRFGLSISDGEFGDFDMDGELDALLWELENNGDRISVDVNFEEKKVVVLRANDKTMKVGVVAVEENVDFEKMIIVPVIYEDFNFFIGCQLDEDDFSYGFGLLDPNSWGNTEVEDEEDESEENDEVEGGAVARKVSIDCNYMTYLDNDKPDRFEKLAKRIFLDN